MIQDGRQWSYSDKSVHLKMAEVLGSIPSAAGHVRAGFSNGERGIYPGLEIGGVGDAPVSRRLSFISSTCFSPLHTLFSCGCFDSAVSSRDSCRALPNLISCPFLKESPAISLSLFPGTFDSLPIYFLASYTADPSKGRGFKPGHGGSIYFYFFRLRREQQVVKTSGTLAPLWSSLFSFIIPFPLYSRERRAVIPMRAEKK